MQPVYQNQHQSADRVPRTAPQPSVSSLAIRHPHMAPPSRSGLLASRSLRPSRVPIESSERPHPRSDQSEQEVEGLAQEMAVASWDLSKIPVFPPGRTEQPHSLPPLAAPLLAPAISGFTHWSERSMQNLWRSAQPCPTVSWVTDVARSAGRPLDDAARAAGPESGESSAHIQRSGLGTRLGHDFSRVPVPGGKFEESAIRPKIGCRSHEAPSSPHHMSDLPLQVLQRCGRGALPGCECEEESSTFLTRSPTGPPVTAPKVVHHALRSGGVPLEQATRLQMESAFGHDFSKVRVHSGAHASASARAVNARAYTVGSDIVVGSGEPGPGTIAGRRLLAHELAHVIQQTSAAPVAYGQLRIGPSRDGLEAEAEAAAGSLPMGPAGYRPVHTQTGQTHLLQRLPPDQQRADPDIEKQRQEAIQVVQSQCAHIRTTAEGAGIVPEAIAGAILWEALENPYHRAFWRLGPGKVHLREVTGKSEAEKVEEAQLVPAAKDANEREQRLQQPGWSVAYIAAIMSRHATNYQNTAGVDIRSNVGVLCTLYQGGHSEDRAKKLAERRKKDPTAQPIAADTMGPWVVQHLDWIKQTMGCFPVAPEPLAPTGEAAA